MPTVEERLVEVHRLAMAGGVADITHDKGQRLCRVWLRVSRFQDVERVATQSLTVGRSPDVLYDLAWAKQVLGEPHKALKLYTEALDGYETARDRGNVIATLNNISGVYRGLGQPDQALNDYNQALPIQQEVGDQAGGATTLNSIGGIYCDQGDLETTIKHLDGALQLLDEIVDRTKER